jgi:hypothetical protein
MMMALCVLPLAHAVLELPGLVAIAVSALVGIVGAIFAARSEAVSQSFFMSEGIVTLLAPPQVVKGDAFTKSSDTPVAVLVLDEFPLNSLLDQKLEIDSMRFPNFAQFTKDAVWYRNATAVNAFTPIALPAILSGKMPQTLKQLPTTESYPANMFTILARSHAVRALESFTRLCPPEICAQRATRRNGRWKRIKLMALDLAAVFLNYSIPSDVDLGVPSIDGKWGDFWDDKQDSWRAPNFARTSRVGLLKGFLSSIKGPITKPPFIFAHVIMPHMPHQFVPSGRMYFSGPMHGYIGERWTTDPGFLEAGYGQFMLQLGATDLVVGTFIDTLKRLGIYERSVVVIAADHGFSMRPDSYRRGDIDAPAFYEDIMNVPLMIKYPGTGQGRVDQRHAQNNDVLPTILDALGLDYQLPLDGRSLLNDEIPDRLEQQFLVGRVDNPGRRVAKVKKFVKAEGEILTYKVPTEQPRSTVDWKYTLPGYQNPNPHNPYFIGPHAELLGTKAQSRISGESSARYEVNSLGDRSKVQSDNNQGVVFDQASGICPCNIQGTIIGGDLKPHDVVALAVNGVLQSFAHLIEGPDQTVRFVFLPIDSAFRAGHNTLDFFQVEQLPRGEVLLKAMRPVTQKG